VHQQILVLDIINVDAEMGILSASAESVFVQRVLDDRKNVRDSGCVEGSWPTVGEDAVETVRQPTSRWAEWEGDLPPDEKLLAPVDT